MDDRSADFNTNSINMDVPLGCLVQALQAMRNYEWFFVILVGKMCGEK